MISASVLDDRRSPKLAWQAVVDACRPVVVVIDPLPPLLRPGDELALDVHVVNDLRSAVADATVAVTCTWRGGKRQWRFRGDVDADAVALVGRLELTVPDAPGDLLLGLALTGRDADDRDVSAREAPRLDRLARLATRHIRTDAAEAGARHSDRERAAAVSRDPSAAEASRTKHSVGAAVRTATTGRGHVLRASCGSSAWP